MIGFKEIFLEKFEADIRAGKIKSILELGSGLSKAIMPTLEKCPELHYLGIEPSRDHANIAAKNLSKFKNAKVINALGYKAADERWGTFDLVLSLSVLEHVKQLDKFLANSVEAAKPGGKIVHRWDLGHALHPSSLKEQLQVWLGTHVPMVLPEHKFVRMLNASQVEKILNKNGAQVTATTYHQMPDHKQVLKKLTSLPEELVRELVEWEFKASLYAGEMKESERLKLFPTVAVWSEKV